MNLYAVSYDPVVSAPVAKQLIAFLNESRNIASWSKPFDGLIMVRSALTKEQVGAVFRSFFAENVQLLVSSADRNNSFGYLIQAVWDWINQGSLLQLLAPKND